MNIKTANKINKNKILAQEYSVEYFHIYTDEQINSTHLKSIEYLKSIRKAWNLNYSLIILIDNYNPTNHTLKIEEVLNVLSKHNVSPDYIAYEEDLIVYADKFLQSITDAKTLRQYKKYISNNKYPCSLLTACWYMLRLGIFENENVIQSLNDKEFTPAHKLVNILSSEYKEAEKKTFKLIKKSIYKNELDNIQDIFIPSGSLKLNIW